MRRTGSFAAGLASFALLVGAGTLVTAQEDAVDGAPAAGPAIGQTIDLDALAEAWSSGNADQVRAFYTEDARIFPIGVDEMGDGSLSDNGPWGMEQDIDREVRQHAGGTYEIFDPVRVRDIATYTWRWNIGGFIITGADILHYKDDLIWRQFIDYQAGE